MTSKLISLGACLLALVVALGAFGAHGLKGILDAYGTAIFEKAVFYHAVHGIGVLAVAALVAAGAVSDRQGLLVCALLTGGILFFSGSLYLLAVTGKRWLGAITPIGGTLFIVGWIVLAVSAWRSGR